MSGEAMRRPRVAVVTNGNYFANLALARLLARTPSDYEYRVVITTGLRRQQGNRFLEALALLRRWGWRYFGYKVATYALPALVHLLTRRPLSVEATCAHMGIPVLRTRNVNQPEGEAWLRAFQPDLLLSYSCPYRIRSHLLDLPAIGALNVHSSALPEYAGVCTYIHVLADGRDATGVTVHEMVEQFDAGRIVAFQHIPIPSSTSVFALFSAQCRSAGDLLVEAIPACLAAGKVPGEVQDGTRRSYFGEPTRHDIGRLRANGHRLMRPRDVGRLVRGG